jgi:hypothetical protein
MNPASVPEQIEYATWCREHGIPVFLHERFFLIGLIFDDSVALAWRVRWT